VVVSAGSGDQFGEEVPLDVVRSRGIVNGYKGVLGLSDTHAVFIQAFLATEVRAVVDKLKARADVLDRALQHEESEARKKGELRGPCSSAEQFVGRQTRVGGCPSSSSSSGASDLAEWTVTEIPKDSAAEQELRGQRILNEQRKADEERAPMEEREK
jgi:hypothetical protein